MGKTLIIPGFKGSGSGHWQQFWLANDPEAILVRQDDWDEPCLESWLIRLLDYVYRYPGSTLVAHSLGVPLVVHAARLHPYIPVKRALLVAPADVDIRMRDHACFTSFVPMPLQPLPFPSTVVASRNDPYIAFDRAAAFAKAWGASLVDMGNAGHINIDSGHGYWPQAHSYLPRAATAGDKNQLEWAHTQLNRSMGRDGLNNTNRKAI